MAQKYLGTLSARDPLHGFLSYDVLPHVAGAVKKPEFRVYGLNSINNKVFLYEEKKTKAKVIGKFFASRSQQSHESACYRANKEFQNLVTLRRHGFSSNPQQVIRPIAFNEWLSSLLVEDYVHGDDLQKIIHLYLYEGKRELLFHKLTVLAHFLANIHNRTARKNRVDFNSDCAYFARIIGQLRHHKGLSHGEADELFALCHRWRDKPEMWQDNEVLVHGDATPVNFIFGPDHEVTAIDLERMKYADRTFDLGRIVGEIQHYFLNALRRKSEAEPFIGHFLWEYARLFPDQEQSFRAITARLPFQIAITLLRVARNPWVSHGHSNYLIQQARKTLRGS